MVQEILTVSRMKSSKVGLRKEKMDFSDLLKREYALFEDPNYRDDSLDAYTEFGVSYDKTSNHWMYDEKPIYILYDKERYTFCTFCDKGVSDGVCLNVVRDKGGNIEKLVSVDKRELEQFVK